MSLAALAILGPLVAAVLIPVLRRFAAGVALVGAVVGLAGALITLVRIADGAHFSATLPGLPDFPLRLVADPLGAVFSAVVAVVSTFVFLYAVGYMAEDDHQVRFFAGMAFFVASMQILVLAGDWILLLAAWELIGLASYLLIGFWYERPGVSSAATRAFLTTRAADVGLYMGVIALIVTTGTSAIAASSDLHGPAATLAGIGFLVAATGKSAQVPLQGWLQDAMAGPTPVSALLHAATLVVAGVVLLTRAAPLLPDGVLLAVGLVGGVTAVMAGLTAAAQPDLKRLLAASTSSQLGLMILAIGSGSVPAAVFHLVTQAAMKSTLFLAAGVFQHDRDSTAFDALRGIGRQRRATFAAFVVAGLALAGVPPLAGFWSKDAILVAAMESSSAAAFFPLGVVASAMTGMYIARACRLLWQRGDARGHTTGASSAAFWMGAGLGMLAVLAAFLGLASVPLAELLETEMPENTIGVVIGLAAAGGGLLIGWFVPATRLFGPVLEAVRTGFRVRNGWTTFMTEPTLALARRADRLDRVLHAIVLDGGGKVLRVASSADGIDAQVHEGVLGVGRASLKVASDTQELDAEGIDGAIRGLVSGTWQGGLRVRQLQTGLVHRELLWTFGGAAAVLVLVLLV